jgi:hypothetical protein
VEDIIVKGGPTESLVLFIILAAELRAPLDVIVHQAKTASIELLVL